MHDHKDDDTAPCPTCLEEFCDDLLATIDMIERHPERVIGAALVFLTDAGDGRYVANRSVFGDEEMMSVELADAALELNGHGDDKDDQARLN
jgi:hypothetical protein